MANEDYTEVLTPPTELIEVELPVCDKCGKAGKIPRLGPIGKVLHFYCVGPDGKRHKREKMRYRRFKEVPSDDDAQS